MLLENKNAVVYGGAGSIGRAVAAAFAREGARVVLAGRTLATLDEVAEELSAAGGAVETAQVDALDERAVDAHADAVASKAGGIDVSFNAIGRDDLHGFRLLDIWRYFHRAGSAKLVRTEKMHTHYTPSDTVICKPPTDKG